MGPIAKRGKPPRPRERSFPLGTDTRGGRAEGSERDTACVEDSPASCANYQRRNVEDDAIRSLAVRLWRLDNR